MAGLKERDLGQMGVKSSPLTEGWTTEPPAEREYAVEPVGEARIKPSV